MVRVQSQHFDFVALSPLFVQLEALSRFALFWHDVHLSNQTQLHIYSLQSLHQLKLVTQHKLRPVQQRWRCRGDGLSFCDIRMQKQRQCVIQLCVEFISRFPILSLCSIKLLTKAFSVAFFPPPKTDSSFFHVIFHHITTLTTFHSTSFDI